jgi:uncharacterized membrane protein
MIDFLINYTAYYGVVISVFSVILLFFLKLKAKNEKVLNNAIYLKLLISTIAFVILLPVFIFMFFGLLENDISTAGFYFSMVMILSTLLLWVSIVLTYYFIKMISSILNKDHTLLKIFKK